MQFTKPENLRKRFHQKLFLRQIDIKYGEDRKKLMLDSSGFFHSLEEGGGGEV